MDAYQTSTECYNPALSITWQPLQQSHFFHNTHADTYMHARTHARILKQCMLQHTSFSRSKSIHSTVLLKQVQQQFDYICATPFVNCLTCLVTQYICIPTHTVWQFTKQTWLGKQSFDFMEAVYGLWLLHCWWNRAVCYTTAGSALMECVALHSSTHLSCVTRFQAPPPLFDHHHNGLAKQVWNWNVMGHRKLYCHNYSSY